jgi:ATP-dependent Lon protease
MTDSIKLPILALRDPDIIVFPNNIIEINVGRDKSLNAIKEVQKKQSPIIIAMQMDEKVDDPKSGDFNPVCTEAIIKGVFPLDESGTKKRIVIIGSRRCNLENIEIVGGKKGYLCGEVTYTPDIEVEIDKDVKDKTMLLYDMVDHSLKDVILKRNDEIKTSDDLSRFVDNISSQLPIEKEERLSLLNEINPKERLNKTLDIVIKFTEQIKVEIISTPPERNSETDGLIGEAKRLYDLVKKSDLPEEIYKTAYNEIKRLKYMPPSASEFPVTVNYIETLISMPWKKSTEDKIDIKEAAKILDEDHYGLKDPKDRIIEHLAVRELNPDRKGAILCFYGPPGTGKAQPNDADVLTPNGFIKMGNISVGDTISTPDGSHSKVIGVFPQGEKDIYSIKFSDGTSTECCKEHLWKVQNRQDRINKRNRIIETSEMMEKLYVENGTRKNFSIPMVSPHINFYSDPLEIHPYILGILLSEGQHNRVSVSNGDQSIINRLSSLIETYGCKLTKRSKFDYDIVKIDHNCADNINKECNKSLIDLHLIANDLKDCLAHQKFIPEKYKFTSAENRLELLAGILDGDGGPCDKSNCIEYSSSSYQLSMDVKFLVESFGGRASYFVGDAWYTYKGEKKRGKDRHRLFINLPEDIIPFFSNSKIARYKETMEKKRFLPRFISNISYVGKKEATCILINHPDHLYITNNFIVTHNTSIGKSIARAMGRKFVRVSLGGVHDEAEIRGHRRTYVGALMGKILKYIKKSGVNNPVFMLDEIDKLSRDMRGDPSSALLEVLDPEQNHAFVDNYLDVPFDLSNVFFIGTVNEVAPIQPALRDRMEIIEINGYSPYDKLKIAQGYLIPKQKEENGLGKYDISMSDNAIGKIIDEYTSEAGVRSLERECGSVLRKLAVQITLGKDVPSTVKSNSIQHLLGPPKVFPEKAMGNPEVGLSVGLAYSSHGGSILFIESSLSPGKGNIKITGNLGKVLKESIEAAYTWIKVHASDFEIDAKMFEEHDIHVHIPQGATPKDGPSAGIAVTSSMLSLFINKPIRNDVAMTGEITLKGRVLPIGGLVEKILAAHRAGIKHILYPIQNNCDIIKLPKDVKNSLLFHPVSNLLDALDIIIVK